MRLWEVAPFRDATGNTPPFHRFLEQGSLAQGPRGTSAAMKATGGEPLTLPTWVADDASVIPGATRPRTPPVLLTWSKFRGPGAAVFSNDRPPAETSEFNAPSGTTFRGKTATTVTFGEPGEYVLHAGATDWSGEGGRGFQCCWTNAFVNVTVKAAAVK